MSEIISERMPSVRILQATPGKLHRRKAEVVSTAELRQEAAQLSALPQDRFRLVWQGTVLGEGFDISKLTDNAMVMVIPIAAPPQPSSSVPEPVVVSDEEVKRFQLAFGSALRNPAFSKVVKRLLTRENMETLAAACPGLSQDLVAQAFLTRPELLIQLLDADTLRGIGTKHPALLEAAHNVAAAVHEEQATSSRNPAGVTEDAVAESEPGSYFLDEMSDEEMDEDESGGGGARSTRGNNQITAGQLASALAAATGGGAGSNPFLGITGLAPNQQQPGSRPSTSASQSAATTPGALRITADMFASAMQQAMQGIPAAASSSTEASRPDWTNELATMKDMGIVDEGLAVKALELMGGDLQAAIDLIFSGWLGDETSMS